MRRNITSETIETIAALGFDVYQNPDSQWQSYLFFTDGTRIGYMQSGYFGGLQISTVHIPCGKCGTGFSLTNDGDSIVLTRDELERAFIIAPDWASAADRAAVRKWKDWESFHKARHGSPMILVAKGVE